MSTPAPAPAPITVTATAHPSHWQAILDLIMRLAPLGAGITANFVSANTGTKIIDGVTFAEEVEPIVIQIAGIQPVAAPPS